MLISGQKQLMPIIDWAT